MDVDDDDDARTGGTEVSSHCDSDGDDDDLMLYHIGLDLSSFDDIRGAHASGRCSGLNLGDD